jgi:hypothetical protein
MKNKMKFNFNSNYPSLGEKTSSVAKKSAYISSVQAHTSLAAVFVVEEKGKPQPQQENKSAPTPPPAPPMPAFGFNGDQTGSAASSPATTSSSTSPLHKASPIISLDSETLVQARQKLKMQNSSSSSDNSDKVSSFENDSFFVLLS